MRLEGLGIRLAPVRGSATANTYVCVFGVGGTSASVGGSVARIGRREPAGPTSRHWRLARTTRKEERAIGGGVARGKWSWSAGAAWESRGWTEGPGARAARKRVRPSTASASPRGDRAHAFLAGSQKSAGARLALERITPSLSQFSLPPFSSPFPLLSIRLFLRVRRDLTLVRGPRKGRVKGRTAGAAAAADSLLLTAQRTAPSRSRETIGQRAETKRVFRGHWLLFVHTPLCRMHESQDIDLPFASTILEFWIPGTTLHRKTEGRSMGERGAGVFFRSNKPFWLTNLRNLWIHLTFRFLIF